MAQVKKSGTNEVRKIVVPDSAAADRWLVDFVILAAQEAVQDHGRFSMALSGGSSPLKFYRQLAALPQGGAASAGSSNGFPWDKTDIWIVDERFVPFDHKDHNGAVLEAIFCGNSDAPGPLPRAQLHLIDTSAPDSSHASASYAAELARNFSETQWPVLDFILLGMGGDGHTASVFPGTGAVDVHDRTVLTCTPLNAPHERVSLTLPVLNAANDIVFLVCGESKREMLATVLAKPDVHFPASLVRSLSGTVVFLCDSAAA